MGTQSSSRSCSPLLPPPHHLKPDIQAARATQYPSGTPKPLELWLGVPEVGAGEAAREGPPAGEKPPGGLRPVGPAAQPRKGASLPTNLSFTTMLGGTCEGPWVGVHVWGGGFFLRDKVGGMGEASWLWALFLLTRLYPVGVRNSN